MLKLCLLFMLFAIATTISRGQANNIDNVIRENKQKHNQKIEEIYFKILFLNETNLSILGTIDYKLEILVTKLEQTNQTFNNLRILSSFIQQCVDKYRQPIPSVTNITEELHTCKNVAEAQLPGVSSDSKKTSDQLKNYYESYDAAIEKCGKSYNTSSGEYVNCVQKAVLDANNFTNNISKKFAIQMQTAHGMADIIVNEALQCSYTTEHKVISSIAEANTLIKKCREGSDHCVQPGSIYKFPEVIQMKRSIVNFANKFIQNPFYHRNGTANCVLLQLV